MSVREEEEAKTLEEQVVIIGEDFIWQLLFILGRKKCLDKKKMRHHDQFEGYFFHFFQFDHIRDHPIY